MSAQTSTSAPDLQTLLVADAMTGGIIDCPAGTPLVEVAHLMAARRIHCVVVTGLDGLGGERPWGIVSDLDLVGAVRSGMFDRTARDIAATELVEVSAAD